MQTFCFLRLFEEQGFNYNQSTNIEKYLLFIEKLNSSIQMIKNKKVQKLLNEGGIQAQKFTLVIRLRKKIEQLSEIVDKQNKIIDQYKKSTKNTIINEMQVQIQHLNDQNKRIVYLLEQKGATMKHLPLQKKIHSSNFKSEQRKIQTKDRFQHKYYAVLAQNDKLKKDLVNYKVHENYSKRKKSINDQGTVALIRNLTEVEKIKQRKCDLQAQTADYQRKIEYLQKKLLESEKISSKAVREYQDGIQN